MKHSDRSISPRARSSAAKVSSTAQRAVARPLLEAAVAGLVGREPLRQVLLAGAATQNPGAPFITSRVFFQG